MQRVDGLVIVCFSGDRGGVCISESGLLERRNSLLGFALTRAGAFGDGLCPSAHAAWLRSNTSLHTLPLIDANWAGGPPTKAGC